jgi:hypothetical protein
VVVASVGPALAWEEGVWLLNVVEQEQRNRSRMVRQILTTHAGLILFITITKIVVGWGA